MRILYLNHNVCGRGGTFFRAYEFGRHLVKRGHSVSLVTISPTRRFGSDREDVDGVQIIQTPDLLWGMGRTGWDPWDTAARCMMVGKTPLDIIHAWDSRPAVILPALWALRRRSRPRLVIDWCDWWGRGGTQSERHSRWLRAFAPVETFFEEAFRHKADGTTVISRALYDRAVRLGVPAETIRILPQGAEPHAGPPPNRRGARQRLSIPETAKVLVSIGALTRSEAELLFAFLDVLFIRAPSVRFFLIGRHGARVPARIRGNPAFTEAGFVSSDRLRDYVEACDALVVPLTDTIASRARWPSKVNPVLALGRTVIITGIGDLAELLRRHRAAVVTECDPNDMAEKACAILADDQLRDDYAGQGKSVAETLLAWPRLADQLADFYDEVIRSPILHH